MSELPDPSTVQVSVDIGNLPSFLSSLVEQLKASHERISALETLVTDLTSQVAEQRDAAKQEIDKLENALTASVGQTETLVSRLDALEALDPQSQPAKLSDFQGTLANLVERVGASEVCASHGQSALVDMRTKIDQLANRSQEISDHSRQLDLSSSSVTARVTALEPQTADLALQLQEISDLQAALATGAQTFQKSLKAEMADQLTRLEKQLLKNMQMSENVAPPGPAISDQPLLSNMVAAAQKAIASAMGVRTQRQFQVRVVDVWRETASGGGKRRSAVRLMNRVFARVIHRSFFSCWRDKTQLEGLRTQLEISVGARIPSAAEILGDQPSQMASLEKQTEMLEQSVRDAQDRSSREKAEIATSLGRANAEIEKLADKVAAMSEDKFKPLMDATSDKLNRFASDIAEVKKTVESDYATNKDMQKLMTDVLLLWNSMKQLDATKADRSELERLANQYNDKLSEILKNFDKLAATIDQLQNKVSTLPATLPLTQAVSQTSTHPSHLKLEQQLSAIAQYLFELVGRLAAMRGIDASKLPVFPSSLIPDSSAPGQIIVTAPPLPEIGQRPRSSFSSSDHSNTTDLLRYARSLVTAAGATPTAASATGASRRELILPADLRMDGAPFRRSAQ